MDDLFNYVLAFYSKTLMDPEKLKKILGVFTITQKGLSLDEMLNVCKITVDEWRIFLAIFKTFIMHYKGYWIINNDMFKKVIIINLSIGTNEIFQNFPIVHKRFA